MSVPASRPVARLEGVVLGVPDVEATVAFLAGALGLDAQHDPARDHTVLRCPGDYGDARPQPAVRLAHASALELVEVRLTCRPGGQEVVRERLADAGAPAAPHPGEPSWIAFTVPGAAPFALGPEPAGGAAEELPVDALRPRRLGHVNLLTPTPGETSAFLVDILGLRLSEQIGEDLHFLRIVAEHHNIGLRRGPAGGLHHLGLEVLGWESYRPLFDALAVRGIHLEYGPGRHGPGRNLFAYLRDPSSGLRVELFADMAQIADEATYVPRRWKAGDRMTKTLNRWGPTPPASFLE